MELPTFDYISLEIVPRAERLAVLRQYLAHVRRTYDNQLVIVLVDTVGYSQETLPLYFAQPS